MEDLEPAELNAGKAFLISKKILFAFHYGGKWDDSALRKFLNTQFFRTVFSDDERKHLLPVYHDSTPEWDYEPKPSVEQIQVSPFGPPPLPTFGSPSLPTLTETRPPVFSIEETHNDFDGYKPFHGTDYVSIPTIPDIFVERDGLFYLKERVANPECTNYCEMIKTQVAVINGKIELATGEMVKTLNSWIVYNKQQDNRLLVMSGNKLVRGASLDRFFYYGVRPCICLRTDFIEDESALRKVNLKCYHKIENISGGSDVFDSTGKQVGYSLPNILGDGEAFFDMSGNPIGQSFESAIMVPENWTR